MRDISDFFKMNDVEYKENLRLSMVSPVKIGGTASYIVYPDSIEKLVISAEFLRNNKIKHKIIGRMSNILPCDQQYQGVIIKTDRISKCCINESFISADAGLSIPYLAKIASNAGLGGLEELSGIPGSIGGAIRGNAGAFGREICELIYDVTVYSFKTKEIMRLKREKINFGYRYSSLAVDDFIIISANLSLTPCNIYESLQRMNYFRQKRVENQPVGYPSLGSVFKRPSPDISAARIIDECGLKGKRIGGAEISNKHAGFIINVGNATAYDYMTLTELVSDTVYERFNIKLEREIEIL